MDLSSHGTLSVKDLITMSRAEQTPYWYQQFSAGPSAVIEAMDDAWKRSRALRHGWVQDDPLIAMDVGIRGPALCQETVNVAVAELARSMDVSSRKDWCDYETIMSVRETAAIMYFA